MLKHLPRLVEYFLGMVILDYNEDDCRATRVLLDGVRGLS